MHIKIIYQYINEFYGLKKYLYKWITQIFEKIVKKNEDNINSIFSLVDDHDITKYILINIIFFLIFFNINIMLLLIFVSLSRYY